MIWHQVKLVHLFRVGSGCWTGAAAGSDWSSGLGLQVWASGGLELEFWNLATTKLAAADVSVGRNEFMRWM